LSEKKHGVKLPQKVKNLKKNFPKVKNFQKLNSRLLNVLAVKLPAAKCPAGG
jgi:hypothetical protein